eukprot:TRINITY_DN3555_c0_g1_i1.p1 TRINITY_DN3555_c0_g1~~TRINITY_DN3555_c0_g1_i1.p1  ORF type:complete len:435 (+),score=85.28 TRINITY_DN3555_c0_g1_i1:73-1305(+)
MALRFLVGDETGLLKRVDIPCNNGIVDVVTTAKCQIQPLGRQMPNFNITAIVSMKPSLPLFCASQHGAIKYVRIPDPKVPSNGVLEPFLGIGTEDTVINQNNKRVGLSCMSDMVGFCSVPNSLDKNWVLRGFSNGRVDSIQISEVDSSDEKLSIDSNNPIMLNMSNKQSLCALKAYEDSCFAYGGRDLNLTLWDLNTNQVKEKLKNVPNNFLKMQVPIWITDIEHIGGDKFATGTAFHQVRLYDVKASLRPVLDVIIDENKINRVRKSVCGNYLVVSDGMGKVQRRDLRKNLMLNGAYKGNRGSVRDFVFSEDGEFLATVGLDRYLRVFEFESRTKVADVYLKQKLNCVEFEGLQHHSTLLRRKPTEETSNKQADHAEEEQDGTIWDLLEEVKAVTSKKRKKTSSTSDYE